MTSPQCRRLANGRWVPASPQAYAALLRAAYPKIKAANPKAIVVAGETAAGDNGGCRNVSTTIGTFDFVKLLHKALGGGRKMPFADIGSFEKNPEVTAISDLFTVNMIARYIQGKLGN